MTTIIGGRDADTLIGSTASELILGLSGDDMLRGGGGNDTISGGQGSDTVRYGAMTAIGQTTARDPGSNLLFGGEGADTIVSAGSSGANTIVGDTGDPSIDAAAGGADFIDAEADTGADLILGNTGDDTILGTSVAPSTVFGTPKPDVISALVGGQGNDVIVYGGQYGPGSANGDLIASGTAVEAAPAILLGNQGDDVIDFASAAATVLGGRGDDAIRQTFLDAATADVIYGGEGADTIVVQGGSNTIVGGTGDPAIDARPGAAGDGNDLIIIGPGDGNGIAGADLVLGNAGDDTIDARGQVGGQDTLVGGQGDDAIFGGRSTNNLIFGDEGDDAISDTLAGAGTDTLIGGQGDDTIVAGDGGTTLAGAGDFAVASAGTRDLIYGDEGDNLISISGGSAPVIDATGKLVQAATLADVGDNTIYGGTGTGRDTVDVGAQADGADLIFGGSGDDVLVLGGSVNGAAAAAVNAAGGANLDAKADGLDPNVMFGGAISTVTGGGGVDTFRYTASGAAPFSDDPRADNSDAAGTAGATAGTSGRDTITDFASGVDRIALTTNTPGTDAVTTAIGFFANLGSVAGATLAQAAAAAARALGGAQAGGTTDAGTFTYGGSADTYAIVETDAGAGTVGSVNLLVDVKGTTSLAKGDFTV